MSLEVKMDKIPVSDIQEAIGYQFKNKRLLQQAFIRSSYANENSGIEDNEKLEFYGDAALDYYISRCMFSEFSETTKDGQFKSTKTEQELTEIKSYNVDTESLAHCIRITGFQNFLLMSKSDKKNNVQNTPSVMADLFEAILGAVVVDSEWDYKKISIVCRSMLKLVNFEINYLKWLKHWCAEHGYQEPYIKPKLDFFRLQMCSQPNFQLHSNPFFINQPSFQLQSNPFYAQSPSFSDLERPEQITGAYLYIKELDLHTDSDIRYEYAAFMECAKKAYDIIQIREMNLAVGTPSRDTAVNQLNILYQKGFIEEPEYSYTEEHDEDGNPIWHCECDVDELERVYIGDSSVKKEAKKEAALGALCKLLDFDIEMVEDNLKDMKEDE